MDIIVLKPLQTMAEEGKEGENMEYEEEIVPPGEYEILLVQLGKRDLFFFTDSRFEGICIGKTMLKIMESVGLIKVLKDEKPDFVTDENTRTVSNVAG